MAKQLKSFVHVHTPDDGTVVYKPGESVPAKHAKLITNPKVWADEQVEDAPSTQD